MNILGLVFFCVKKINTVDGVRENWVPHSPVEHFIRDMHFILC